MVRVCYYVQTRGESCTGRGNPLLSSLRASAGACVRPAWTLAFVLVLLPPPLTYHIFCRCRHTTTDHHLTVTTVTPPPAPPPPPARTADSWYHVIRGAGSGHDTALVHTAAEHVCSLAAAPRAAAWGRARLAHAPSQQWVVRWRGFHLAQAPTDERRNGEENLPVCFATAMVRG
jgi:hypothetical protein